MEYLKSQGHPGRMAPGVMTAAIADALIVGSGIIEGYAVAMIGIDGLMATKGVYAGDTVSVEFEVRSVSPCSALLCPALRSPRLCRPLRRSPARQPASPSCIELWHLPNRSTQYQVLMYTV